MQRSFCKECRAFDSSIFYPLIDIRTLRLLLSSWFADPNKHSPPENSKSNAIKTTSPKMYYRDIPAFCFDLSGVKLIGDELIPREIPDPFDDVLHY